MSNMILISYSAAQLFFKGRVLCLAAYGWVQGKEPLGLFEKSRGLSPVPGF